MRRIVECDNTAHWSACSKPAYLLALGRATAISGASRFLACLEHYTLQCSAQSKRQFNRNQKYQPWKRRARCLKELHPGVCAVKSQQAENETPSIVLSSSARVVDAKIAAVCVDWT